MSQKIEILLSSTSYPQSETDWRGVFIRQMLRSLAAKDGLKVHYWGPYGDMPSNVSYRCSEKEKLWLERLMERGGIAHLLREGKIRNFYSIITLLRILRKSYYKNFENISIFHINWLQNAIPLLGTRTSALITVLGTDMSLLNYPGMTGMLRHVFKNRSCTLAPNADWMIDELNHRFGDVANIKFIPLGIDEEWFKLKRKAVFTKPYKWLVVSRLTSKKLGHLFEWGKEVFRPGSGHELHLFGPMQEEIYIPDWVFYHGSTYPEELRSSWFPDAAGLVTLSQHDEGRPQVMLEAMASGLPIIASRLPAHDNFMVHAKTGWLAESSNHFRYGINWLSQSQNSMTVSENAKKWVKKNVGTWADCAERYYSAYCNLLRTANGP